MTSAQYGQKTQMIRDRFEKYISNLMKRYFSMQLAEVKLDLSNNRDPFANWSKWDKVLTDWVEPKVRVAIRAANQNALDYMGLTADQTDIELVFRAGEVMRRLDEVNNTTKDKLEEIIRLGKLQRAFDPSKTLIENVVAAFQIWIGSRAPAIGLTVSTASIGSGVDMAIRNVSESPKKRWRAFLDKDTRDSHREADGQEVYETESFLVDGESLRWPGDPFGSPGNIINCRCYVEPII